MNHLSDVFKYISKFRHAGHQVGRKVGDMLEVLTYAAIETQPEALKRLVVEPKLFGFSDAGHKVEFVLMNDPNAGDERKNGGEIMDISQVSSFIECKKVGVEQTINGSFKKGFEKVPNNKRYKIPFADGLNIKFAPRGLEPTKLKIEVSEPMKAGRLITVINEVLGATLLSEVLIENHRLIFALNFDGVCTVIGNKGSLRDFPDSLKNCRILEIYDINNDHYTALLNDCLCGPQTPEKAKQASFVALDVRKKRFNSFDKRENETDFKSVLVMTEFSHWEQKSQNMITACIDQNLVVPDSVIIEAFELFEAEFGADFYDRVTKEQFENNADVKRIAMDLVRSKNGLVFCDIADNTVKKITVENGVPLFTES